MLVFFTSIGTKFKDLTHSSLVQKKIGAQEVFIFGEYGNRLGLKSFQRLLLGMSFRHNRMEQDGERREKGKFKLFWGRSCAYLLVKWLGLRQFEYFLIIVCLLPTESRGRKNILSIRMKGKMCDSNRNLNGDANLKKLFLSWRMNMQQTIIK
ncbi:unnamed protein product [Lactuca saligna]|uniref:Uncharacterized protein n=1 Tax=Lactuca saligna TaxID=75948 RepID=A0AA36ECQ4_LACSI|nr:unnamed protein product [Lactuca saligna]